MKLRVVIVLRYFWDLSNAEIAEILDLQLAPSNPVLIWRWSAKMVPGRPPWSNFCAVFMSLFLGKP
jgi:hypothetical protein